MNRSFLRSVFSRESFQSLSSFYQMNRAVSEIRSLAVHPDHLGKKIGSKLTEEILLEAESFAVKKIFALTNRPDFFKRFGFVQIDRSELPLKIWADCIMCVKFPDCDEIAMMKEIDY